MSDLQEFTQADVSNLRRLLGKAGPERSFDVMKESWRNSSKALILSTTTNCWISMPTVPNYGSDTQVHDRIRPWSFVWKCFRQVCWSILRKDPGGFYSSAFHPDTDEKDSWWLFVSSGAFNGHAQAWYKSIFGDESALPEPVSFNENAV